MLVHALEGIGLRNGMRLSEQQDVAARSLRSRSHQRHVVVGGKSLDPVLRRKERSRELQIRGEIVVGSGDQQLIPFARIGLRARPRLDAPHRLAAMEFQRDDD
jgi:hypothetical protein